MSAATREEQSHSRRESRRLEHEQHKRARSDRFGQRIYGTVKTPVIPSGITGVWDPPSYAAARRTARTISSQVKDGIDRKLDMRCFFTGVQCHAPSFGPGFNHDPRLVPWLGTKDHLVPARRDLPDAQRLPCPQQANNCLVWSSNVANVTLGLAPLAVRLKIRQWLMTIPYDREDISVEAGNNMRWLIIHLIDWFRIDGRFPWSRKPTNEWWSPEISVPFMTRMFDMESRFVSMDDESRDDWVRTFSWQF